MTHKQITAEPSTINTLNTFNPFMHELINHKVKCFKFVFTIKQEKNHANKKNNICFYNIS